MLVNIQLGEFPFEYEHRYIFKLNEECFAFHIKTDGQQCGATCEKAIADYLGIAYNGIFTNRIFIQNTSTFIKNELRNEGVKGLNKMLAKEAFLKLFEIYSNKRQSLSSFLVKKGLTHEEIDGYEADLYVKYSDKAVELILEYGKLYNTPIVTEYFLSEMDGSKWMSLPFQNMTEKAHLGGLNDNKK